MDLDVGAADLGYVVINFETAWSPRVRVLERLQEVFCDLAFSCWWFAEEEFLDRYCPGVSTAIARSERERQGEHVIATLYLTKAEYPDFFLETQIISEVEGEYRRETMIEPMTEEQARLWILMPEVKLLALCYPELPKAEIAAVGGPASTQTPDSPIAETDNEGDLDGLPF